MCESARLLTTAGVTLLSVFVGYGLSAASANRKARRSHKTELRRLRASLPVTNIIDITKPLDEWWLRSIDDCGWLRARRIARHISDIQRLEFPVPDWDINVESDYTTERTTRYQQKLDEANKRVQLIFDRIMNTL